MLAEASVLLSVLTVALRDSKLAADFRKVKQSPKKVLDSNGYET